MEHKLPGQDYLQSISCVSVKNCAAVGSVGSGTLAEHWNGSRWVTEPTPQPPTTGLPGDVSSALESVSCRPGNGCTAVGASTSDAFYKALPLIDHRT
jgi:hypothetical protein